MDAIGRLERAKRIVVKIGSSLLVDSGNGRIREHWLQGLAEDIAEGRRRGVEFLVVSSGAIALGRRALALNTRKFLLEHSQAAAAVGQIRLARAYEEVLAPHGIVAAQILLTLDDNENRRRYLNSRATFATLLDQGAVPVVNENDTVATDEIRYGDNDRLAARVAVMAEADLLVLLSDVDGLYSADPRHSPGAKRIEVVREITPQLTAIAGEAGTDSSKGGMRTKLLAAEMTMSAGCAMAIAKGSPYRPLKELKDGASCTWFLPERDPRSARKHWIAGMMPKGDVHIDAGAAEALRTGKSLLPAGVVKLSGDFGRGDPVQIVDPTGRPIGKGLARYTKDESELIRGRKSSEIEAVLGYSGRAALVHRDDMAV